MKFLQRHTCSHGQMTLLEEVCFRINRVCMGVADRVLSPSGMCYWQRPRSEFPPYGGLDFDFDTYLRMCNRLEPEKYRPKLYSLRRWIRFRCVKIGSFVLNLTTDFSFWRWLNWKGIRYANRFRRWRAA